MKAITIFCLFLLCACSKKMSCNCYVTGMDNLTMGYTYKYDNQELSTKEAKKDCARKDKEYQADYPDSGCSFVIDRVSTVKLW